MKETDFSGVDPLRLPEARRRVAALNKYLDLPDPTTADAIRISAEIDLSRWQFTRLARVWREHRRPDMLVVGRRGPATRIYDVDPRGTAIAHDIIDQAGPTGELASLAIQIESECASEGVLPPSRPTIWNHIRKARASGRGDLNGPPRVVIGRLWFHLPIVSPQVGPTLTDMPVALVAMALPERTILSYVISLDDAAPPNTADLLTDLIAAWTPGADCRQMLLDPNDRRAAAPALNNAGIDYVRSWERSVQREISRALGGKLGTLKVVYRRGLARPKTKHIIQRQDERISAEDAVCAIEGAIEAHNRANVLVTNNFVIARPSAS
jgi:hypothetical protein